MLPVDQSSIRQLADPLVDVTDELDDLLLGNFLSLSTLSRWGLTEQLTVSYPALFCLSGADPNRILRPTNKMVGAIHQDALVPVLGITRDSFLTRR